MKNLTTCLLAATLLATAPLLALAAEPQALDGQQAQPMPNQDNGMPEPQADSAREGNDRMMGADPADEAGARGQEYSSAASGSRFIERQSEQQMLASNLIGYSVTNLKNENVGRVEDLILDQTQRPVGIVIAVGGFLGLGAKHVALPLSEVQINGQNKIVQVSLSKDELDKAPSFTAHKQEPMEKPEESSPGPDM